jgi:cell division protein FtsQ
VIVARDAHTSSDGDAARITAPLRPAPGADEAAADDPLVVLDDDELVLLGENDADHDEEAAAGGPPASPIDAPVPSAATLAPPSPPSPPSPEAPPSPEQPSSPEQKVIRIGFDDDVPAEDPVVLGTTPRVVPDSVPTARPSGSEPSAPLPVPGRRTITITDESLAPDQDATSPAEVDPRMRARRVGVLRSVGRRRLRIVAAVGLVAAVAVGGVVLLKSPLLSVKRVQLDGAAYIDRTRLAGLVSELRGTPLVDVDTGAVEQALEADPWVKRARVERDWFSGVRMDIVERIPVATFMSEDQGWRIVDSSGAVIVTLEPGHKPLDMVTIQASSPGPDLDPGSVATGPLAMAAAVAPRLPERLQSELDHIAVGDDGSVELVLGTEARIVLGRPERLRDKLISSIVAIDGVELDQIEVLDVSTPERPVLTMRAI